MAIKSAIRDVIGRTSAGVFITKNRGEPQNQLFIVFSDGTHYEIWGHVSTAGGVDRGGLDEAERYARSFGGELTRYE
jgi:hypothetical protein